MMIAPLASYGSFYGRFVEERKRKRDGGKGKKRGRARDEGLVGWENKGQESDKRTGKGRGGEGQIGKEKGNMRERKREGQKKK